MGKFGGVPGKFQGAAGSSAGRAEGMIPLYQGNPRSPAWHSGPLLGSATRLAVQLAIPFYLGARVRAIAAGFPSVRGTYALTAFTNPSTFTATPATTGLMSAISGGIGMAAAIYETSSRYIDATDNFMPRGAPLARSARYAVKDLATLWATNNIRWYGNLLAPLFTEIDLDPGWYYMGIILDATLTGETGPRIDGFQESYGVPYSGAQQGWSGMDFPAMIHTAPVAAGWDESAFLSNWETKGSGDIASTLATLNANMVAHRDGSTITTTQSCRYTVGLAGR